MSDNKLINDINESIKKINFSLSAISKNYFNIGGILYNIKNDESIEKTNFKEYKNISEFAEAEFGFDKTKTYNLIAIYEKFFLNYPAKQFYSYKYSQLREMLSMDSNKIELCNENMTIKEIQAIKDSFSSYEEKESIDNTELIKNNNVIEVVFPEQKEDVPEEKVTTIIVTELPNELIKENKTITVNVKTEQNDDYAINQELLAESNDDYYKKEYLKALDLKNKADIEIIKLNSQIDKLKDKNKDLDMMLNYVYNDLQSFHYKFKETNFDVESIKILLSGIKDYKNNYKLPEKLYFMKNVI